MAQNTTEVLKECLTRPFMLQYFSERCARGCRSACEEYITLGIWRHDKQPSDPSIFTAYTKYNVFSTFDRVRRDFAVLFHVHNLHKLPFLRRDSLTRTRSSNQRQVYTTCAEEQHDFTRVRIDGALIRQCRHENDGHKRGALPLQLLRWASKYEFCSPPENYYLSYIATVPLRTNTMTPSSIFEISKHDCLHFISFRNT